MLKLTFTPSLRRRDSGPMVGAMDPIGDHRIVFILSQCLSSPWQDRLRNLGSCGRGSLNRYAFHIFSHPFPKHWNYRKLFLKDLSQPNHVCLHTRVWLLYFLERVEVKENAVKLQKIKGYTLRNTTYSKDFASSCNVDGIVNGRGWLGSF